MARSQTAAGAIGGIIKTRPTGLRQLLARGLKGAWLPTRVCVHRRSKKRRSCLTLKSRSPQRPPPAARPRVPPLGP
eukprot:8639313-Alexandrium_andersonii.AAC.1